MTRGETVALRRSRCQWEALCCPTRNRTLGALTGIARANSTPAAGRASPCKLRARSIAIPRSDFVPFCDQCVGRSRQSERQYHRHGKQRQRQARRKVSARAETVDRQVVDNDLSPNIGHSAVHLHQRAPMKIFCYRSHHNRVCWFVGDKQD